MSKKLEDFFNVPAVEKEVIEDEKITKSDQESLETLSTLEKIESGLPKVNGLEASDEEFDELAKEALNGYKQLLDLGMEAEERNAGEIFSVASNLLGHSITAKKNKIEKKLKTLELLIKKARLDQLGINESEETSDTSDKMDRNTLLATLMKHTTESKKVQ